MPEPMLAASMRNALGALGIVVPEAERALSCRKMRETDGENTIMETENYIYILSEDCSTAFVQRKGVRK